jgi:ketosteroid isomerase-like protein
VAAFYDEDGMRMPPNAPAVEGREAIQGQIAASRAMGAAKVELGTDEMATSGDLGFARGTYVIRDAEGNEVDRGKWLQVGKKVGDSWYAYRDIWNSDNPLPMPPDG